MWLKTVYFKFTSENECLIFEYMHSEFAKISDPLELVIRNPDLRLGSGSGSRSYINICVPNEKISRQIDSKSLEMIKCWTYFSYFFKSLINSKDPEPDLDPDRIRNSEFMDTDPDQGGKSVTDPPDLDLDPQHWY